jgi:uncharacterized membrane protein SirB2
MRRVIQRVLAAIVAATTAVILFYLARDPLLGAWPKALLLAITATAFAAPAAALLVVVATVPIAFLGSIVSAAPFHEAEALVVSAICGGSCRIALRRADEVIAADLWPPWIVSVAVVTCSLAVMLAGTFALDPSAFLPGLVRTITADYLREHAQLADVSAGILALESLLLFAAAERVASQRPQWTAAFARMLVVGAAGAAALNVLRLLQIGFRSATPLATITTALRTIRINTGYGDVNAAGSYFALAAVVTAGAAVVSAGGARMAAVSAGILIAAAAWLTGSRAAVAAAILGAAALLAARLHSPTTRRFAVYGLMLCALATIVFVAFFSNPFTGPEARFSVGMRLEMARIALRIVATHPIFGVGAGQFYAMSGEYLAASPLRAYYTQENAHNNFLQVLAEFGLAGLLAAGWLAVVVIVRWTNANRALATQDRPLFHTLTAANIAFVATMLLGHPLLTPAVSYVFALSCGALTGMSAVGARPARRAHILALVSIGLLLAALPFRMHSRIVSANLEHVGWGVSEWQPDSSGEKMRRPTAHATLFVPPRSRWIELPCRLATPGDPVRFAVFFRGHRADDLVVTGTALSKYRLVLGELQRLGDTFEPLELKVISGEPSNVLLGKLTPH